MFPALGGGSCSRIRKITASSPSITHGDCYYDEQASLSFSVDEWCNELPPPPLTDPRAHVSYQFARLSLGGLHLPASSSEGAKKQIAGSSPSGDSIQENLNVRRRRI